MSKKQEIPQITFKSGHVHDQGIEIILVEELLQRKDSLDHDPEKGHQIAFNMMVFFTQGETKHLVDFVWHEVRKNTLIYLSKGQINAFNFVDDLKGYIILFTSEYFQKQLNKLSKETVIRLFTSHLFSPKIQVPNTSNVDDYISLLYNEFYSDTEIFNRQNIIDNLFNVIFSKLEQLKKYQTFHIKESNQFETFLQFKTLVEQHYQESRNAAFYAEKLHITYKHLNTISKAIVNNTAKEFIDEFVILEAKRQLNNSAIKSTELAFSLGFEEPTNFVKYFKKHTGLTPNMFKKQHEN